METWRTYMDKDKPVFSEDLKTQELELTKNEQLIDFQKIRKKKEKDIHRPDFHFCRPDGYLNDPNGLCFWEGKWHLFYQALGPNIIHWGHAISDDIVYWRDLPYAIYPKASPFCFSGGTCVDHENHRVIAAFYGYTGYDLDTGYKCGIVIATSSDPLLLNWTQVNDGNPVIPDRDAPCWVPPDTPPVKDQKPYQVFDAYIWKENGTYYLLTGGYTPDPITKRRFRQVYMFRTQDDTLCNWEFVKPFLRNDIFKEVGDDGACPHFVPIGENRYLFAHYSHRGVPKYLIGIYDTVNLEFTPFSGGRFTSGYQNLVAPSAFSCPDKSVAVIFNCQEQHNHDGWSGIMTLPRRLTLGGQWQDELYQEPFADLAVLHDQHIEYSDLQLKDNELFVLPEVSGKAYEFDININCSEMPQTFEIEVLRSPNGEETTKISIFKAKGGMYAILPFTSDSVIMLDASHSSSDSQTIPLPPEVAPLVKDNTDDLKLKIFVDKSIVEVFVNGKQCVCQRAYPMREDSTSIALRSRSGDCIVERVDFWTMKSIYSLD